MRLVLFALSLSVFAGIAARAEEELPIFDAHLHYSHDAWDVVPPKEVIGILRRAGVKRAMVSSSNNEGTRMLQDLAPGLIVPELRPYRSRGEISTWAKDPSLVPFLEEMLAKRKYVAIGEFHIYGADADLPNMRKVVELAKKYGLFLHSHSDADAVMRHFQQDGSARVLWAHSGFERPEKVREMLRRYPSLWCDLAFLTSHASNGKVAPGWREAFLEFPDRFVVGTDTFTPERWHYVIEHARWSREWLADLPPDVARKIAYENGDRLFGGFR
jgi:Amidohydrolase